MWTLTSAGLKASRRRGSKQRTARTSPLDIIVYATGYYAYSDMKRALTFQVNGLNGRNLNSEWEEEAATYKGILVSGYPNYFKVNGPNTGSGHSSQLGYMEASVNYILKAICAVKEDKDLKAIDAKADLQAEYMTETRKKINMTVWQNGTVTAFYRKNMTGDVTALSPEPVTEYILSRRNFRLSDYNLLR